MKQAAMAASSEFTWSNAALQYEAVFQELGVKDLLNGNLVETKQVSKMILYFFGCSKVECIIQGNDTSSNPAGTHQKFPLNHEC